jgi:MOSC domain-containing protein YiiM
LLAMAAIRLGAVCAMGIDHDPVAIECAQEYARTNRFGEELSLHCGEIDGGQSFDLVLANLDRQTLLGLADRLTSCTRSRLLVSGVLVDQAEEIVAAFATAGLYLGQRREQDGWLAMEFMRAQPCEDVYIKDGRSPYPHVHQISVSDGGVPKRPVFEARVGKTGVERDRQENLKFHGGPDRAVCLYSLELLERLQDEGHLIDVGLSGENLTIAGLEWNLVKPGSVLSVGPDLQLEVTSYAAPCNKNGRWFRDGDYQRISQEKHPGWSRVYAKVLREGVVRPGDAVTVEREGGQG